MAITERLLFDGTFLRLTAKGEGARRVFFTFGSYFMDRSGWNAPHLGTSFTDQGFTHVRLTTRHNDWYLNRDLPHVLTVVAGFRRRHGLAMSMGGYGLYLMSRVVDFEQVLMFSPQVSYRPDLPPFDTRYPARIVAEDPAAATHATMAEGPPSRAECVIVYDPLIALDEAHARLVGARFVRPRYMALRGNGHPSTIHIGAAGKWGRIVRAVTARGIKDVLLIKTHAEVRAQIDGPGAATRRGGDD